MSEPALLRIYEAGRCIDSLAHRRVPEWLLLRIAREHHVPEAILTLALIHYAPDVVPEETFLSFVREYVALRWLRQSIRVSDLADELSGNKQAAALALIDAYEAEHGADADWEFEY